MEKYYYQTKQGSMCTERCKVLDDGTAVGSFVCSRECEWCADFCDDENWVVCHKIKEATEK